MKKNKAISSCIKLGMLGLLWSPLFLSASPANTTYNENPSDAQHITVNPDSIGTEIINNEVFIIHRIEPKDTYYALGRRYGAQVNRILAENNKKNLKPGDTVKIPTGRRPEPVIIPREPKKKTQEQKPDQSEQSVLTEYKVGVKETLYAISKRFNTTVENIKSMNELTSDSLQQGQVLKIPDSDYRAPTPEIPIVPIIDTPLVAEHDLKDLGFETNRYGIREKKEKGIGMWMENLETDGKSNLALHKTAPVGTILKITNPMTRNVTYAKVVGKFKETQETRDAIVVLSKSAASYIGALDKRFLIEIAYGVPLN